MPTCDPICTAQTSKIQNRIQEKGMVVCYYWSQWPNLQERRLNRNCLVCRQQHLYLPKVTKKSGNVKLSSFDYPCQSFISKLQENQINLTGRAPLSPPGNLEIAHFGALIPVDCQWGKVIMSNSLLRFCTVWWWNQYIIQVEIICWKYPAICWRTWIWLRYNNYDVNSFVIPSSSAHERNLFVFSSVTATANEALDWARNFRDGRNANPFVFIRQTAIKKVAKMRLLQGCATFIYYLIED